MSEVGYVKLTDRSRKVRIEWHIKPQREEHHLGSPVH